MALLSERFSSDLVCQNFVPMIRHLTGSSVRSIVECHRHKSFRIVGDKQERVKKYEQQFLELKAEEQESYIATNLKFQEEQDAVMKKIRQNLFPENSSLLKFKFVNYLSTESVLDYAVVYGNDIESLTIQTLIHVRDSKLTSVALISILVDAMAAFCRLKSSTSLHTIPYFNGKQNMIKKYFFFYDFALYNFSENRLDNLA